MHHSGLNADSQFQSGDFQPYLICCDIVGNSSGGPAGAVTISESGVKHTEYALNVCGLKP